jgi:uncharacterized protein (TIGR02677 family)
MEARPWRAVDADLFRFSTTDLRELHIAIMVALEQAAVLAPALNLDQVRTALVTTGWDEPTTDEALQNALGSLTGWQLLEATQDHSARYSTPEEFERKNLQWSLTARGEAAVAGLLRALDALRHTVGLQTAVLDAIGDGLAEIKVLQAQPRSREADDRIHIQLIQVEQHLTALVGSVRQFNGHLQRLLRDNGSDDDVFDDVKHRTVSYLEEYVENVERPHRRLATALRDVDDGGRATLFDRALTGAHLAPVADGDPAPAWLAERERRWQALRAWFAPYDGARPMLDGLLDVARTAIIELLRVLERRWESRRRSASMAHDFRALAGLFARAPGDAEAHALFAAAFGLWPARHAHLRSVDGTDRLPSSSWLATEPVEVAPALRTTGTLTTRGRSRPINDPRQIRAARQREQAEHLAHDEALRDALATDGEVRLSEFGRLGAEEFGELLALLAAGLDAACDSDGVRRALSADGRVEVVLRDPRDGRTAVLVTDSGELRGPDLLVSIEVIGKRAEQAGVEADMEAVGG